MKVDVRHTLRGLSVELGLYPREQMAATVRSLNKTLTTVRAEAARKISDAYRIKVGEAKKGLRIENASRTHLKGAVVASGRPIPLIAFSARQTKRGVTVIVTGRKSISHAFIATMRSGHRGVFVRTRSTKPLVFRHGKGSRIRRTGQDLPISELLSISIPAAFVQRKVSDSLISVAQRRFAEVFAQEARFRLSKRGG